MAKVGCEGTGRCALATFDAIQPWDEAQGFFGLGVFLLFVELPAHVRKAAGSLPAPRLGNGIVTRCRGGVGGCGARTCYRPDGQ